MAMTTNSGARAAAIMAIIILVISTCSGPIADWRTRNIAVPLYRAPDPAALEALQELFDAVLREPMSPDPWSQLGFVLETKSSAGSTYLSIREAAGRIEGKGGYLLRPASPLALVLQAPHGDTDRHTEAIAERLFLESSALALAVNSLPRWAVDRRGRPADLAARPDSVLLVFTMAVIARHPRAAVVQLHGFEAAKRETQTAATADLIISDGTREPSPEVMSLRDCLIGIASGRVLLYSSDVFELGGTRNAIGRAIRGAGTGRFLHIEMSLPFRERLLADGPLFAGFARCLAGDVGM